MGGDISFSATEVAIVSALLSAVVGPLGMVFWLLLKEKDARIKEKDAEIAEWRRVTRGISDYAEVVAPEARENIRAKRGQR